MTLRDFLQSMASVIRLSRKSDREEFFLYLKLVVLGLGVVGVIGFMVKLISTASRRYSARQTENETLECRLQPQRSRSRPQSTP